MNQSLLLLCLTFLLMPEAVQRVIDGDTFVLYHVGVPPEERVRLLGVDTPERNQPGFAEATAFTSAWLAKGPASLTACKRDSFGRLLVTVQRGDESLGQALLAAGLAVPMVR